MFDAIEEPLDMIAVSVEIWAETDRIFSIGFRRKVSPSTPRSNKLPNGIAVISSISEEHAVCRYSFKQTDHCDAIVLLSSAELQTAWQTVRVN
jgi:hypothetical protein